MSKTAMAILAGLVAGAIGAYWLTDNSADVASSQFGLAEVGNEVAEQQPATKNTPPAPALEGNSAPVPSDENLAQTAPAQTPSAPAATQPPAGSQASDVDETALRYFARQGDTKRLQAEIARLRALYPDWTPPADPLAVPPQTDAQLDQMWQLYSQGKYAELRKTIADRRIREPNWQPPQDLLDRLAVAEARERLINASNLKQFETVVRVAADTPSLLTCSEVDVLWRVAEAFAMTSRSDRARDAYLYVLKNCENPAERLATVQKALPLLPRDLLDQLLATEKPGPDDAGEFAAIRADLVRESVAAGGADPPATVPEADVTTLESLAQRDGLAADARLLGWYYLRHEDAARAEKWFSTARRTEDTAETSQGLALALLELNRPAEAEDALYKWRDASDTVRTVYFAAVAELLALQPPPSLEPMVLQRIVSAVAAAKNATGAQQLGWYAHAFGQEETAGQWFSAALGWKPDDEASAYGLAVVRMALGDKKGVTEIQRQWADRSERIATMTGPQVKTAAVPFANGPKRQTTEVRDGPSDAVSGEAAPASTTGSDSGDAARQPNRRGCSKTDLYSPATGEAALTRGWCLMELNRPSEAVVAFEAAFQGGRGAVQRDAAWGQTLAYVRLGLADEAAVAAARMPQTHERTLDLEASILSLRATGFFEKKRYAETILALDQRARIAPERLDLMTMRGYAYLALRRINEARQIFQALAAAGDPQGQRGLGAVRATIDPTPQD